VARPRQGFLDPDQFEAVARQLSTDLRPLATFMYWTGWRSGEVKMLEWRMVDREAGVIRIETTKNDEPRTIPYAVVPALREVIESQRATADAVERKGRIVPWVFHRKGERIKDFMGAWQAGIVLGCRSRGLAQRARRTITARVPSGAEALALGSIGRRYGLARVGVRIDT
jgi:integrase